MGEVFFLVPREGCPVSVRYALLKDTKDPNITLA